MESAQPPFASRRSSISALTCSVCSTVSPSTQTKLWVSNPRSASVETPKNFAILINISTDGRILSFSQFETHCLLTCKLSASSTWLKWRTLFALFSSFAFRAVTADAFSVEGMNDVITIKVYAALVNDGENTLCDWGTFYRGIELPTSILYETGTGTEGEATIAVVDEGNNFYTFATDDQGSITTNEDDYSKLVYEKPLDTTEDGAHDFTAGGDGKWTPIDDKAHWTECSGCNFLLQVAHRLDGNGVCMDCGYELVKSANTYKFSGIPDYITNISENMTGDWVEFNDDGVATFEIGFEATLFLGSTLTLYLECEKGVLTADDGATIPYEIDVSRVSHSTGDPPTAFPQANTRRSCSSSPTA